MSKTYRNIKGQKVKEGLIKGKKRHSRYFRRKKSRDDYSDRSILSRNRSNFNDQRLNVLVVDERIFYDFKPLID